MKRYFRSNFGRLAFILAWVAFTFSLSLSLYLSLSLSLSLSLYSNDQPQLGRYPLTCWAIQWLSRVFIGENRRTASVAGRCSPKSVVALRFRDFVGFRLRAARRPTHYICSIRRRRRQQRLDNADDAWRKPIGCCFSGAAAAAAADAAADVETSEG